MITLIILIGLGIAEYVAIANGDWGPAAVGAVLILLLIAVILGSRSSDRAYLNATRYWEKGGPEGEANKARTSVPEKPVAVLSGNLVQERCEDGKRGVYTCPGCGKTVQAIGIMTRENGILARECWCPECKAYARVVK